MKFFKGILNCSWEKKNFPLMYALFGNIQNMYNFHNLENEKQKALRMLDNLIIHVCECVLSLRKMLKNL